MADGSPSPVTVVITVPHGAARPDPLAAAIEAHHPDWEISAVWAGDPQLRPVGPRAWSTTAFTERELAQVEPEARPMFAAVDMSMSLPEDRSVIVLTAGAVAVLGPVHAIVPAAGRMRFVPRLLDAPDVDERFPHLGDLSEHGSFSTSLFALGAGDRSAIAWMRSQLLAPDPVDLGPLFDLAAQLFPADRCDDPNIGVSVWRWGAARPALLDAPGFDAGQPWVLDARLDGLPRVSIAEPSRQAIVTAAAPQLAGPPAELCVPGGIPIDRAVRSILRAHPGDTPRPWSDAAAFRRFVDERYWSALQALNDDLHASFPHPNGTDAARYAAWVRHAAYEGRAPLMVDPSTAHGPTPVTRTADRTDGVNLIGYFRHQSGIANIARAVADVLDRHGVPHTTVAYERTEGPLSSSAPDCDQRLEFATSLVFVNGDQFAAFHRDLPDVYGPGRRVVGVWFWELESLEGAAPVGDRHVDEIWSATTFMARAFEGLGSVPVRVVPIPFAPPQPSDRARSEFEPLSSAGERFVFGVVLDHLSITARKNPFGVIGAFRQAFAAGAGPMLVVKTINAHRCWQEHERLRSAAADRDDIVVWDEHLTRDDHHAFIRSLDVLVSLHRSEGLGLHLAEAMWMGVPVIATRYSGNLDFMDDDSAVLVDARLVPVGAAGGWAYPATASWADPDLDAAAAAMRRLAADPATASAIGEAGRTRMLASPGEAEFVRRVRELFGG